MKLRKAHYDYLALAGLAVWAALAWSVLYWFGDVIVDGFQSIGAAVDDKGPGKLTWPFLDSWRNYDEVWGFHWFGWPWLRSLFTWLVPWSPGVDLGLQVLIWAWCGWLVYLKLQSMDVPGWLSLAGMVCTLVTPHFLLSAQSYRPETLGAALCLAVILAVSRVFAGKGSNGRKVVSCLAFFAFPSVHNLGIALPFGVLLVSFGLAFWQTKEKATYKQLSLYTGAWVCGVIAFGAWYALQPTAWEQFSANLVSQRECPHSFGNIHLYGGILKVGPPFFLWAIGLLCGIWFSARLVVKKSFDEPTTLLFFSSLCVLGGIAVSVVTANPNSVHLLVIIPAMALSIFTMFGKVWSSSSVFVRGLALVGTCTVFLSGAFFGWRVRMLAYGQDPVRSQQVALVNALPEGVNVYIPVSFWEAAALDEKRTYYFKTFPNFEFREARLECESLVYSYLRPGDIFIEDTRMDERGLFNEFDKVKMEVLTPSVTPPEGWELLKEVKYSLKGSRSIQTMYRVWRRKPDTNSIIR